MRKSYLEDTPNEINPARCLGLRFFGNACSKPNHLIIVKPTIIVKTTINETFIEGGVTNPACNGAYTEGTVRIGGPNPYKFVLWNPYRGV